MSLHQSLCLDLQRERPSFSPMISQSTEKKNWHPFSILKKVGNGEWDLLVGNRKHRLNYVLATEQIKGLQNTTLNIK